jgi:hypothetical protein
MRLTWSTNSMQGASPRPQRARFSEAQIGLMLILAGAVALILILL